MHAVPDSADVRRVAALPRRSWSSVEARELARRMTSRLRTPSGTMALWPTQAIALYEIATHRGILAPIPVGGGKTLISQLAPVVARSRRPLLLAPAHLLTPARASEIEELRAHWQLPIYVRSESYQLLATAQNADLIEDYEPDLIVADECHYLKNPRAACTRRVRRYLDRVGEACRFVGLSGTLTGRSLRDYAHLGVWALGRQSPTPLHWRAVEDWARATDPHVKGDRLGLGALRAFGSYHQRFVSTPGIVTSAARPLPIDLEVRAHVLDHPPDVIDALGDLRARWETPDGWPVADGATAWRHAQELALGFFMRWNPRPPREWLDPRREWASACRETLASNRRGLDTEAQMIQAVDGGLYPHLVAPLEAWRDVRDSFTPNSEAVWISDYAIDKIRDWMARGPGIVWTPFRAVGHRFGDRYYGPRGRNSNGEEIERASGAIVASIKANATGRNLQGWARNLVAASPSDGISWEQMIGRTHRSGQRADRVSFDVLFGCVESLDGFWRAAEWASRTEELTQQAHKLSHASIEVPERVESRSPAWNK